MYLLLTSLQIVVLSLVTLVVMYSIQTSLCTITSNRGSYVLVINQFTDCLTTIFNTRSYVVMYSFKQSAACCNLHRKKCMHAHAKLTDQITAQNWK